MNLHVTNGASISIPGLGRNKPLVQLSEKRVTKAVREALRQKYGFDNVEVSCAAEMSKDGWRGTCEIRGVSYEYRISS